MVFLVFFIEKQHYEANGFPHILCMSEENLKTRTKRLNGKMNSRSESMGQRNDCKKETDQV